MTNLTPAPILVAEDDAQHALLIRAALKAAKLANPILVFEDGEQALGYLGASAVHAPPGAEGACPPVLALLDVHLPGTSGLEVLTWMREQAWLCHVPAVVLTASEEAADIDHAFAAGASSYLIKPVGFQALLDVVRNLDLHLVLTDGVEQDKGLKDTP